MRHFCYFRFFLDLFIYTKICDLMWKHTLLNFISIFKSNNKCKYSQFYPKYLSHKIIILDVLIVLMVTLNKFLYFFITFPCSYQRPFSFGFLRQHVRLHLFFVGHGPPWNGVSHLVICTPVCNKECPTMWYIKSTKFNSASSASFTDLFTSEVSFCSARP